MPIPPSPSLQNAAGILHVEWLKLLCVARSWKSLIMRLHTFTHTVADASNRRYLVHAEGDEQPGGEWFGWLVFEPVSGGPTLRTGRETTQSSREDLDYWVSGLEVVYLDGALTRASPIG